MKTTGFDDLIAISEEEGVLAPIQSSEDNDAASSTSAKEGQEGQQGQANQGGQQNSNSEEGSEEESLLLEETEKLKTYFGLDSIESVDAESIIKWADKKLQEATEGYSLYNNPQVQAFANHIASGGDISNFTAMPQVFDDTKYSIDKPEDVELIIKSYYRDIKGLSDEEIEDTYEVLKTSEEKLKSRYGLAVQEYKKYTQKAVDSYNEQIEAANKEISDWNNNYIEFIDKGTFAGIKLEEKEIKEFKAFMTSDKLVAQRQKYDNDFEFQAYVNYLIYKDFNVNGIVKSSPKAPVRKAVNLLGLNTKEAAKRNTEFSEDEELEKFSTLKRK